MMSATLAFPIWKNKAIITVPTIMIVTALIAPEVFAISHEPSAVQMKPFFSPAGFIPSKIQLGKTMVTRLSRRTPSSSSTKSDFVSLYPKKIYCVGDNHQLHHHRNWKQQVCYSAANTHLFSSTSKDMDTPPGVRFLLPQSCHNHLLCIKDNFGEYVIPEWTTEKTMAVLAGAGCGVIFFLLAYFLLVPQLEALAIIATEDKPDFYLIFSTLGFILGWSVLGEESISKKDSRRKDGGTLVKFVVDRPERSDHLLQVLSSSTSSSPTVSVERNDENWFDANLRTIAEEYVTKYHDPLYIASLRAAVQDAYEFDAPRRLRYEYASTMVDGNSYEAALSTVAGWIEAVRGVLGQKQKQPVTFVLSRPPSHHAMRSKGTGGCLLNGAALAAMYALDELDKQKKNEDSTIAILDIDAHHGNGIADMVQFNPRLKYCSIHDKTRSSAFVVAEDEADKDDKVSEIRTAKESDTGPLGNILNIELERGTTWEDGYKDALINRAIPFLKGEKAPDIILVAAGFDALKTDVTSSLYLIPSDFNSIGGVLRKEFGDRVAFGLEGGYTWQTGELGDAVLSLTKPWY